MLNNVERSTLWLLLLLAAIGSLLSLTAIRPDADDVNYTSRVVYFLENPDAPLDLKFHDYWILQTEMTSALKIFQTWTFFCGYIAYLSGIPFLDVYHLYLPALGGAAIPLAWFLAFTKFTKNPTMAVLASLAVCVFLSLNGEPHRAFGNFAFVRIWHSKAILMSAVPPLFLHLTLNFFERPSFDNWKKLFLLLTTCAGLSAMATYFMPFLGVLFGASSWFKYRTNVSSYLRTLVAYFSAYAYLALLVSYTLSAADRTRIAYFGFAGWPDTFIGQFKLVFIDWISYPFTGLVAFSLFGLLAVPGANRKFLATWLILSIALFINPIVFPIISKNITTLNTYWRLFYLLPFPLVVGLTTLFLERTLASKPKTLYIWFAVLIMVGACGNILFPHVSTFARLPFAIGQYKFNPTSESEAKEIIDLSVPGPMLAPTAYSTIIPIYTSKFPQVVVREFNLMAHAVAKGELAEAQRRVNAQRYVSGSIKKGVEDVAYFIDRGLVTVVMNPGVMQLPEWAKLASILEETGFRSVAANNRFSVYTRLEEQTRPGTPH
jgi:hypothetical protein